MICHLTHHNSKNGVPHIKVSKYELSYHTNSGRSRSNWKYQSGSPSLLHQGHSAKTGLRY